MTPLAVPAGRAVIAPGSPAAVEGGPTTDNFAGSSAPRHVAIALVPETPRPAAGGRVTLAFAATPSPGWHAYWKNGGDAGVETTLAWTLPNGVTAGPLSYPVPGRLLISGLMNYVYERPFTLFAELTVPAGLAAGTRLPVAVNADYLVCTTEICVPEKARLTTELVVGDGAIQPAARAQFDGWRRALPRPLGAAATFQAAGGEVRIAVPYPAAAPLGAAYFYPLTTGAIDYAAPQAVAREGDRLVIATRGKGGAGPIDGVLATGDGGGFTLTAVAGIVPAAPMGFAWGTLLAALGGALLGGLLLNIMPCVFPILSLKALSLARSGETGAHARAEALAYTAGVMLTCVALGGLLLAIRAAGVSAGWAFQLQEPRVVLVLMVLVLAIALNLAGLFELGAPGVVNRLAANGPNAGRGGAFATGALAAFVATPCTGPFMGAALGAALVLPTIAALAVFAGLGLGIALPFLLIGFVPALRRRLPKPGAWMVTLRRILAVPMFLTALALAWVLGRQAGADALTLGLACTLLVALGLWWTGLRQGRGRGWAWTPAAAALALAAWPALTLRAAPPGARTVAAGDETFSEARLAALRAEGKPVFAYFTADWCLTCKVNEKVAIETAMARDAFAKAGVAVLVGDWTDGDPALGRFIERHNRAGVPLYLWYAKGAAAPRVLPQLLTPAMLAALPSG